MKHNQYGSLKKSISFEKEVVIYGYFDGDLLLTSLHRNQS